MDDLKNNTKPNGLPFNFPDDRSNKEKSEFVDIWEKSRLAKPEYTTNLKEVEESLSNVKKEIGLTDKSENWWQSNRAKTLLAAACLLITISLGYLSIPITVKVPPGEIASVTLPDGSQVMLNSMSVFKYSRLFGLTSRSVTLKGEAFFDVTSDDMPFTVMAGKSLVKVKGTQFNIRSWPEEANVDVAVLEGSVQWHPVDQPGDSVALNAGQAVFWNINTKNHRETTIENQKYYTGWTSRDFAFRNRSLKVIFSELERRFNIHIEFGSNVSTLQTLTAYYPNPPDAASILADICRVKGLQYVKTKHGYKVIR